MVTLNTIWSIRYANLRAINWLQSASTEYIFFEFITHAEYVDRRVYLSVCLSGA